MNNKGYSLIEVVVTILIISLLFTVVLTAVNPLLMWFEEYKFVKSLDKIGTNLINHFNLYRDYNLFSRSSDNITNTLDLPRIIETNLIELNYSIQKSVADYNRGGIQSIHPDCLYGQTIFRVEMKKRPDQEQFKGLIKKYKDITYNAANQSYVLNRIEDIPVRSDYYIKARMDNCPLKSEKNYYIKGYTN